MHSAPAFTLRQTDLIFYAVAALLGLSIAMASYYMEPASNETSPVAVVEPVSEPGMSLGSRLAELGKRALLQSL